MSEVRKAELEVTVAVEENRERKINVAEVQEEEEGAETRVIKNRNPYIVVKVTRRHLGPPTCLIHPSYSPFLML